jgi:hypothetical protein
MEIGQYIKIRVLDTQDVLPLLELAHSSCRAIPVSSSSIDSNLQVSQGLFPPASERRVQPFGFNANSEVDFVIPGKF